MTATPEEVLTFWREAGPEKWFKKDSSFDDAIRMHFLNTHEAAMRGELTAWEQTAKGALALCIVLDQFPRNMFRGSPRAFAADPLARTIADRTIAKGFDLVTPLPERQFFYLPFEHSEDLADQERSVMLFRAVGDPEALKWAQLHLDIIHRFRRFPHRNAVLGRTSTPEEQAFLNDGGFAG